MNAPTRRLITTLIIAASFGIGGYLSGKHAAGKSCEGGALLGKGQTSGSKQEWQWQRGSVWLPFDVPAKEYSEIHHIVGGYDQIAECPKDPSISNCHRIGLVLAWDVKVTRIGCEDKRRVLLASEDGKHHCYAFYALGGESK